MTELLQRAIAEMEKLPDDDQDAVASRILAELADDQEWTSRFEATSTEQWRRLADKARRDLASGRSAPVDSAPPTG
jgi:hypothetical protein